MQKLSSKVATILNFQSTQKDTFGRSAVKEHFCQACCKMMQWFKSYINF